MFEICKHCRTNIFPNTDRTCPQCSGNLDGDPAPQPFPHGLISHVCPKCGGSAHRKVKPDRMVAFAYDRICESCNVQYVLPTPIWAAIVFILAGLFLAGFFGFEASQDMQNGVPILALWKLLFIGFGLVATVYGIRSLAPRRATK